MLGEIVPKTIGLNRAEVVALWVAAPVRLFFRIFQPFIWVLQRLARIVNRSLGLEDPHGMALVHSEDELKMLVSASKERGVLEADEQEMLHKVFDFADTHVEDVMRPRPDVAALKSSLSLDEAVHEVRKHPYTRYPVYRENLDEIVGLLHIRSLFDAVYSDSPPTLETLLRPAQIVPETKELGEMLKLFRRTSTHMAIVVDEYGSTAGIVTLEDLIEEIVGEIDDEFDKPGVEMVRLGPDQVRIAGSFTIEDFNELFGTSLSDEDYVTVGGFVFGELGEAPKAGASVKAEGCTFTVHEIDGARILKVDVALRPHPSEATEETSPAVSEG